jgi:hypothetical protein
METVNGCKAAMAWLKSKKWSGPLKKSLFDAVNAECVTKVEPPKEPRRRRR